MATPIPRNRAAFSLQEIALATAGQVSGGAPSLAVCGVTGDSRAVEPGNLYVALRGERHDGHHFVADAFARGAAAALVQDSAAVAGDRPSIVVPDTLHALGSLAATHRKRWGGRVVAITGSAGKTTTKELTFAALRAAGARAGRTEGNLNNLIGTPMTLLGLDAGMDVAVIEVGTSAPGEIARLAEICEPDVGVVTSVSAAHTLGLGSVEAVAREKASLLWALPAFGTAIYCADDPEIARQLGGIRAERRVSFGSAAGADVRLLKRTLGPAPDMTCELQVASSGLILHSRLRLFGIGPALDAAAAIAAVRAVFGNAALEAAARGLGDVPAVPGRLSPLPGPAGSLILDDTYNANPASMRFSIDTAIELARVRSGRALFVLGDMLELGDRSRAEHEAIGRQAAQPHVAAFFACGVDMTAAAETAREHARATGHELSIVHLSDPAGAAALLRPLLRSGDVVLIKGSRSMSMERAVATLTAAEEERS
jgi:UDP-N-acetylmuramoyl-tripeptide--D-alanyl-D-alanine ligase